MSDSRADKEKLLNSWECTRRTLVLKGGVAASGLSLEQIDGIIENLQQSLAENVVDKTGNDDDITSKT